MDSPVKKRDYCCFRVKAYTFLIKELDKKLVAAKSSGEQRGIVRQKMAAKNERFDAYVDSL